MKNPLGQKKLKPHLDDDQVYFEILAEKPSIWRRILNAIFFPIRLVQFLIGRILSHIILNPDSRSEEGVQNLIVPNTKYAKKDDDLEIVILDVIPPQHPILRTINNWLYALNNYLLNYHSTPSSQSALYNRHFSELVGKIAELTSGELLPGAFRDLVDNKRDGNHQFKPQQIHLRGVDALPPQYRIILFNILKKNFNYDFKENQKDFLFYKLKTPSASELDSVEIRGNGINFDRMDERKFIIFCNPWGDNYLPYIKQSSDFANQLGATVVAFNYQGTGPFSKGLPGNQYDLRNDALAQFSRLIALGANPENIAFFGNCLGANIATQAAAYLHREGYKVGLFNSRSFSSSEAIILSRIWPAKNANYLNPTNWLRIIGWGCMKLIISPILYFSRWDLDVKKDFLSIPPQSRDFLVVRSSKNDRGKRYKDDFFLSHSSSIYSVFREQQKNLATKPPEMLTEEDRLILNDDKDRHKFIVDEIYYAQPEKINGHSISSKLLIQRNHAKDEPKEHEYHSGKSYQLRFFNRFFKNDKIEPHLSEKSTTIFRHCTII